MRKGFLTLEWFQKHYNIDYTAKDIAKLFNVKPEKVRNRVYQLRKKGYDISWLKPKVHPPNHCIDCNVEIEMRSKRCGSCASKQVFKNKGGYLDNKAGRRWTQFEIDYLKKHYAKGDLDEISRELNRSKEIISKKARRIGVNRDFETYMKELGKSGALFTSKDNPMNDEKVRALVSKKLKKFYLKHPEKLLNSRMRRDRMTYIEKIMSGILDSLNVNYDWNKYVRTRSGWKFPDFRIKDTNLLIECDGEYWHNKQKDKDLIRQKELEEVGFEVIRFSGKKILNDSEEVKNCLLQRLNQLKG